MSQGYDDLEGYNPSSTTDVSKRAHLHDDLDTEPEAHHHSIGLSPNQAVSFPLAKSEFDSRYSSVAHTHSELTGDNVIINGDASQGDKYWTRVNVSASSPIAAERFISQLSANPSSCTWKSEQFTPVQNETMTGQIKYQGSVTGTRIKVDVLWNATGALPDISDGVSTTVSLLPWTTVALVDTDDVSGFSWTVPSTATAARVIVTTDNGSVTTGFPVNVIFDDVQLVSKLREVSPLYVGVTSPQVMEGPLTITEPYPLSLPDGAAVGLVLKSQNVEGDVAWQSETPAIKYIQDTEPVGAQAGELWLDTSIPDVEEFMVIYDTALTNVTVTADSAWHDTGWDTLSLDIPCEGMLFIEYDVWLKITSAGDISQYRPYVKTDTDCVATNPQATSDNQHARWVNAGTTATESNGHGSLVLTITSVAATGGNLEIGHEAFLSTGSSGGGCRRPSWRITFKPFYNQKLIEV